MTVDTKEMIEKCLTCTFPDCHNCLDKSNATKINSSYNHYDKELIEWAELHGMRKSTLYSRVKRGGVEFAKSGVKSIKEWNKMRGYA